MDTSEGSSQSGMVATGTLTTSLVEYQGSMSSTTDHSWTADTILGHFGITMNEPTQNNYTFYDDLPFDIPQQVQTPRPEQARVSQATVAVSQPSEPLSSSGGTSVNCNNDTARQEVEINISKPKVSSGPRCKQNEENVMAMSMSQLQAYCLKLKTEVKATERRIDLMNNLIIEEQDLRETIRKKRDELKHELTRVQEERNRFIVLNNELQREKDELQKTCVSQKLLVQQLEAKVIDLKFDNNKMEKQLKETGEHDVPKLKDEVREQRKVIKNYEKLIDEKTETIKNLRRNLDEAKSLTAGSVVRTDKDDQIEELKSTVCKLQSEMIKIMMQMRKELRDAMPKKNTVKSSPEYLSETDNDLRSYYHYRNEYSAFDSGYTLSPASSISSVSPPLSVASVLSANSKSSVYTGPPVSTCSTSAVTSPTKVVDEVVLLEPATPVEAAERSSVELPDLEQQPVESEGICATVEDNVIEELNKQAEEPNVAATHVDTVRNIECVQFSSSCSTAVGLPSSPPHDGAQESGVSVATTGNNQPPVLPVSPSKETKSSEENVLGDTEIQSVQDLRAKTNIPTKIAPKSLEPKWSPKRKKVKSRNTSRSAYTLSDSDSDLSDSPVKSKSPVKVPSPVKFPSPGTMTTRSTFSPPRTRSQSKTPSPAKRKCAVTPWYERKRVSPAKRMINTKKTKIQHELFSSCSSSSDSSSESEDDSGISNAGDSSVLSQDRQGPGNSKSNAVDKYPGASVDKIQDTGANDRTPSETHPVPTPFTLADDLRMSSDEAASDQEFTDATVPKVLPSVKVLEPVSVIAPVITTASTATTSTSDAESVAISDAKSVPTFMPPPAKVISPKRRLSFPSGVTTMVSQTAAAKEKTAIPDRVRTLPAIFRRQAPLESVTEKRTNTRSSTEIPCESDVSIEDVRDNPAKRVRMSHESSSVKTMNGVRPQVAVTSKPQAVVPVYRREKNSPLAYARGNSANNTSGVAGGIEKRLSARERIGRSVEIVAVGSGENICDKRRLELFVKEKAEQRKAEKTQGESKPTPSRTIRPAMRTTSPALTVSRLEQESKNSTVESTCSGRASAPFQRQARKVPIEAKITSPVSMNTKINTLNGAAHPTTRSSVRSAVTLPARETVPRPAATRRSSTHSIPERTISTRRTPVQESPMKSISAVPNTETPDHNPSSSKETSCSTNQLSSVTSPPARVIEFTALVQPPEVPRGSAIVSPVSTPVALTSAVSPPLIVRPSIMSPPAPYLPQPPIVSAAYDPPVAVPLHYKNISSPVTNPGKSDASVAGSEVLARARLLQLQRPAQHEEGKAKNASQMSSESTNIHKLLFGHSSRSLCAEDIAAQLKSLIAAGEEPLSPDAFVKALYFDFCESIGYYLANKIDERLLINGCEKTCATIEILKQLLPHVYADIESKAVLYFSCEVLAQPIRYPYPKNDLLNQMAVCYGTICRHFNLRDLSFRLFLTVMIYRAPQKFTFAHGLVLAYPDLWSCPFEYGSLLERCTLVGLMHGSLYTNSVYYKNLHAMIQDGVGLVLPTCSYAQSFSAFLDEFKELDFRSAMEDSARGIGMLLLQTNWSTSRKLIEEHVEKLFKEWQAKQITDGVLEVFINTTIWVSELANDPEPGFAELMSILVRISEHLDALPLHEAPELNRTVKDGLVKLSRLIDRGPVIQSELVYYKIEDQVEVKKQLAKVTQTEKKRRKKHRKREEARKQKKLLEELAQVDT